MNLHFTQADALAVVVLCVFAMFAVEAAYQERRRARAQRSGRPGPNKRRK